MTEKVSPCNRFSSRSTIEEAIAYSNELLAGIPSEHRISALTALWVPLNTALIQLEKLDLSKLNRQPIGDVQNMEATISQVTPSEAAQHVRNTVVPHLALTKELTEILPREGKMLTIMLLLVAKMFNLGADEIIEEMAQIYMEKLERKQRKE